MVKREPPKVYEIPLNDIKVSPANVRHTQTDKNLDELAASIKKLGLLQPVVLRGQFGNPQYELIVGQRRYLAHQKLKKTILAEFAGELTDVEASIWSLAENMHRVELNHADAAKAITDLFIYYKRDEKKVKKATGLSLQRIRQYVYIQERAKSAKTKRKLHEGRVAPADVQRVLRAAAGDIDKADGLLEKMEEYKLTGYQKERLVECGESHPKYSADRIIEEARRLRVERQIAVRLSDHVRNGLQRASDELSMDPSEVALQAIEDWLSRKGFMVEV